MDPTAHRLGSALCIASAIAFGAMAIFGKLAYDAGVGILTLLFVRFSIAAPVLWLGALQGGERVFSGATRRTLLAALALGAVGYAMQAGLYFAALARMDASLLSMLLYTFPAMVTVAAIALGRETASRRRTGALLVSSGGLALVLLGAGAGTFDWLGAALGLGAALTYTAYILVSDRVGGELRALPLSALITTGAAITFGVACAASGSFDTGFASEGWLWLTAIAIVSTVTPIALFFAGLRRVGPSTASILSTLEPLTTVALAFVVFGETLSAVQVTGAALVLGAAVWLQRRPRAPQPVPARLGRLRAVLVLRRRARWQLDLVLGRLAGLELAAALELGVQLGPEQHGEVRDPHPDQERHGPAERPVGLAVGAEVRHVEGERRRGEDPDHDGHDAAGRDPLEAGELRVRRGVVEDRQHQRDDHQQHRPLGDVEDRQRGVAERRRRCRSRWPAGR